MAQTKNGSGTTKKRSSSGGKAPSRGGSASERAHKTKAAMRREQEARQRKRQTVSIFMFAFAVLYFVLYAFPGVSGSLHPVITGLFGAVTPIFWCALIVLVSFQLAMRDDAHHIHTRSTQGLGVVMLLSAFIYLFLPMSKELAEENAGELIIELYQRGAASQGVGVIGGLLPSLLVLLLGRPLTIILAVLATFIIVMLITKRGMQGIYKGVAKPVHKAGEIINEKIVERRENPHESRRPKRMVEVDIPIDDEPLIGVRSHEQKGSAARSRAKKELFDDEIAEPKQPAQRQNARQKPASPTVSEQPKDFDEILERVQREMDQKQIKLDIAAETVQIAKEVKESEEQAKEQIKEYVYPPVELLDDVEPQNEGNLRSELTANAERLLAALNEYGVEASIVDICRGPAVTRYELKPGQGVKINRITNLQKDIALRLAAEAVRIEAPIPGKSAVGIEIPNASRSIVKIKELIASDQFRNAKGGVVVCIGKDIDGNIVLADITKMPHVLIAGATGQGKSVCINSMLISIVYKYPPQDVRLIMIDPKEIELGLYNSIPHMLVPVVSDPKKAAGALQWAIGEMDKRYSSFKEFGVRDIVSYNKIVEGSQTASKLPKIIIVIDELADLMATSPKEVETSIARLAAKARAAGMHIILATQRPSVDVITGTIKNNIPCRMAFTVSSNTDARTIMDEGGAEHLIGKGDMLFKPVGAKPKRIQGSFVDDSEVNNVIEFIKANGEAQYDEAIQREIEQNAANSENGKQGAGGQNRADDASDPLYFDAIEVVMEAGEAAVSMLQRRLGIGYARAGKLIDLLASQGIVGPYCGSKARPVLISREEYLEMKMRSERIVDTPTQLTTASLAPKPAAQENEAAAEQSASDGAPF